MADCLVERAASLGPECRNTKLAQVATQMVTLEQFADRLNATVVPLAFVFTVAISVMYFLWKRRQWAARRAPVGEKLGGWSTGLFTFHWGSCLPSFLFPSVQSALVQAEVHNRDSSIADVVMNLPVQSVISNTYHTRQALRERYDMPEEPLKDCLVSAFCLPCAIAQHTREVEARFEDLPAPEPAVVGTPVAPKLGSDSMMV